MAVSKWNFGQLEALFNQQAVKEGVMSVYNALGKDIQGCVLGVDEKTDEPCITFVFEKGSQPDLTVLPKKIGAITVKHEFRPPAHFC